MARLFPAATLTGVTSSLKSIDPLDCVGDGSGHPLVEGDRAVVFNHEKRIIFYSLEIRLGGNNQDIGFEEIVPTSNPGDWYWKCRGFTKSTFSGAFSGEVFQHSSVGTEVSTYVPDGFIAYPVPYSESAIQPMGNYQTTDDYSWYGSALWNGETYAMIDTGYYHINHATGIGAFVTLAEPNSYGYYWHPGWDISGNPETDKYAVDLQRLSDEPEKLARFNLETLQHDAIYLIFPLDWEGWVAEFGGDSSLSYLKVGEYHYCWGGSALKSFKINTLTGELTRISNPDSQSIRTGWWCVDYNNEIIYTGCSYYAVEETKCYQYDIAKDTWSSLPAQSEFGSGLGDTAWYDEESKQVIVINTYADYISILDLTLRSWNHYLWDDVISWDNYWTSYSFQMRGIGCVEPFGYDYDTTSNELLDDLILPAKNPTVLIKD